MAVGICWECGFHYEFPDEDFELMKKMGCPNCGVNSGVAIE